MDILTTNSDLMLERSMEFLWAKQAAVLDNMSNAETPNYKTKYVTFEEALDQKLLAAQGGKRTKASVRDAVEDFSWTVHEAGEATRMDGNGVNVTEQSLEMIRNSYQLQYVMNAVSGDFAILRAAITG